jgi:hypothetical protein
MTVAGEEVNVAAIVGWNVPLFRDDDDQQVAWRHFWDHALNHKDEWEGWCLLLAGLGEERQAASGMNNLKAEAQGASPRTARRELLALYHRYLGAVKAAIETGVRLKWHWRQKDTDRDACWHTFAPSGVRGLFTEERVLSGHLPTGAPMGTMSELERYNLFLRCLKRIRDDWDEAREDGTLLEKPGPEYREVLERAPDQLAWRAFGP